MMFVGLAETIALDVSAFPGKPGCPVPCTLQIKSKMVKYDVYDESNHGASGHLAGMSYPEWGYNRVDEWDSQDEDWVNAPDETTPYLAFIAPGLTRACNSKHRLRVDTSNYVGSALSVMVKWKAYRFTTDADTEEVTWTVFEWSENLGTIGENTEMFSGEQELIAGTLPPDSYDAVSSAFYPLPGNVSAALQYQAQQASGFKNGWFKFTETTANPAVVYKTLTVSGSMAARPPDYPDALAFSGHRKVLVGGDGNPSGGWEDTFSEDTAAVTAYIPTALSAIPSGWIQSWRLGILPAPDLLEPTRVRWDFGDDHFLQFDLSDVFASSDLTDWLTAQSAWNDDTPGTASQLFVANQTSPDETFAIRGMARFRVYGVCNRPPSNSVAASTNVKLLKTTVNLLTNEITRTTQDVALEFAEGEYEAFSIGAASPDPSEWTEIVPGSNELILLQVAPEDQQPTYSNVYSFSQPYAILIE